MKIGVLDPKCMEFVRGGLCFSPYLTYAYLKGRGEDVELFEDWPISRFGELPDKDVWIIGLWSYPQVEACRFYDLYLPGKKYYEGYVPLIKSLGLPVWEETDYQQGCYWFGMLLHEFSELDSYDMDAHVVGYPGRVVPVLLSYGCDYRCAFCPTAHNRGQGRVALSHRQIDNVLQHISSMDVMVHFHDEDLFQDLDTSLYILEQLGKYSIKWLCLSTVKSLADLVDVVGPDTLLDSGYILAELGLESAAIDIQRRMSKRHSWRNIESLLAYPQLRKFWLTITFYPGETIGSLATTGEFLRSHGFVRGELLPRIATNSCEGGLGQFFQPYIGTRAYEGLDGIQLTQTYHRLVPSFLPFSLLNQAPMQVADLPERAMYYLGLYGIDKPGILEHIDGRKTIGSLIRESGTTSVKKAIELAIMARLGIIEVKDD